VETKCLIELGLSLEDARQKLRIDSGILCEEQRDAPDGVRPVAVKALLAGHAVDTNRFGDRIVDHVINLGAVARPAENRVCKGNGHVRLRIVGANLGSVGDAVLKDALLDVALDVGK